MQPLFERKVKCNQCGYMRADRMRFKTHCEKVVCIKCRDGHIKDCEACLVDYVVRRDARDVCVQQMNVKTFK